MVTERAAGQRSRPPRQSSSHWQVSLQHWSDTAVAYLKGKITRNRPALGGATKWFQTKFQLCMFFAPIVFTSSTITSRDSMASLFQFQFRQLLPAGANRRFKVQKMACPGRAKDTDCLGQQEEKSRFLTAIELVHIIVTSTVTCIPH